MPRGKYVNHKGRSRHFTSPEELQQESEDDSEQSTGSEDEGEQTGGAAGAGSSKQTAASGAARKPARTAQRQKQQQRQQRSSSDEESDDDDSDDDSETEARDAKKGVAALIEIENPNRVTKKATQKLSQIKIDDTSSSATGGSSSSSRPELSRREREQIEKQKARQRYEKLHAAGKTTEAKADLARLALIRQQREEAAAKREAEKKVADLAKKPLSK